MQKGGSRMMYKKICIPLMQINSNIYGFLSGILVSIATNVFTTLTFEKFDFLLQWHQFVSTLLFTASAALCMWISVKVAVFQSYINGKQIVDRQKRYQITEDSTQTEKKRWVLVYIFFILTMLFGFITLALNWALRYTKGG